MTIYIECDASDYGIAGILCKNDDRGNRQVVEYASRILKSPEVRYTITEKECLAIMFAISKFRPYIADRPFTVITDHSALLWLLKNKDMSGRLTRWALRLQEFDYSVQFKQGKDNTVADALSRGTTVSNHDPPEDELDRLPPPTKRYVLLAEVRLKFSNLTPEAIRREQLDEEWIFELIKKIRALNLKDPKITNYKKYHLIDDILYYSRDKRNNLRTVIPRNLVNAVLKELHSNPSSGHYGIDKMGIRVKDRAYWNRMGEDIENFVKTCKVCQLTKPSNKILKPPLEPIFVSNRNDLWSLDIMGPYTHSSRQNKFLLVMVDQFSKWLEVFPLRKSSIDIIAAHLADMMSRYGTPTRLLSDNGPQFLSKLYEKLCTVWGVKFVRTSIRHPNSNFTENVNRTVKRLIRSYVDANQKEWDKYIPQFLLAARTTINTTTGFSPAQLFLGKQKDIPWDTVHSAVKGGEVKDVHDEVEEQKREYYNRIVEQVRQNTLMHKLQQKIQYDKYARMRSFKVGDYVKRKNFVQSDTAKGITGQSLGGTFLYQ